MCNLFYPLFGDKHCEFHSTIRHAPPHPKGGPSNTPQLDGDFGVYFEDALECVAVQVAFEL